MPDENTEAVIAWFAGQEPVLEANTTIRRLNMGSNEQTLTIAQGAVLTVSEDIEIGWSGTVYIDDGSLIVTDTTNMGGNITVDEGELIFLGGLNFGGNSITVGSGSMVVHQTASIAGDSFSLDDGEITFLDNVSVNDDFTVQTGTVNVGDPGPPIVSADLTLAGDANFFLNNGTLNVYGESEVSGGGNISVDEGSINFFGNSVYSGGGDLNAGNGTLFFGNQVEISGGGAINAQNSSITMDGANWDMDGGAIFDPGTSEFTITGTTTITGPHFLDMDFYDLIIEDGANVYADIDVTVNNNMTVDGNSEYIQSDDTNLNVIGTVIGDPQVGSPRPYLIEITILNTNPAKVRLRFNVALVTGSDGNGATNPDNYEVENESESIENITQPDTNIVEIEFSNFEIEENEEYVLVVNNLRNASLDTQDGQINTNHRKRFGQFVKKFFSRKDGDWDQKDSWSRESHTGSEASRIPGEPGDQVIIGNGHEITVSSQVSLTPLASVTVESSSKLVVSGAGTLITGNKPVQGDGEFELKSEGTIQIGSPDGITDPNGSDKDKGNIRTDSRSFSTGANYAYNGTPAQQTGDGLPQTVNDLTINNSSGVETTLNLRVDGKLELSEGILTIASGNSLIADNRSGSGSVRYLRDITGNKGWRLISSPVGTTFGDFLSGPGGGFTTQGFTGADLPDEQPNILHFAEDTPESPDDTVTTNMAWRSIEALSNAVESGRGYFAYVFDGAAGPGEVSAREDDLPFTISASDTESTADPFDFGITRTARQIYTDDAGWNLVGNPYGAALDWNDESSWTKDDIHSTIYVWDPNGNGGSGAYLEWNGSTGSLGGSEIAPFQAFWVKAEGPGAELSVSPDARTLPDNGDSFYGKQLAGRGSSDNSRSSVNAPAIDFEEVVIRLDHESTGFETESRLMFSEEGSVSGDRYDAYRLAPLTDSYLSLFTLRNEQTQLVINSLPIRMDERQTIPMDAYGVSNGMALQGEANISWGDLADLPDDLAIHLKDRKTGDRINMRTERSYRFDLASSSSSSFRLSASVGSEKAEDLSGGLSGTHQVSTSEPPVVRANQHGGPFALTHTAQDSDTRFEIVLDRRMQPRYSDQVPAELELHQNYPNPFNHQTTLRFALPEEAPVRLAVYDVLGRKISLAADGTFAKGLHEVSWDASGLSSGTYIYRLEVDGTVRTRKMTLVK